MFHFQSFIQKLFARSIFLHVVVITFIFGGLFLLIAPVAWFPAFYAPRFMGLGSLFFVLVVAVPRVLFKPTSEGEHHMLLHLQHAVAFGLVLSASGELGLWQLHRVGFEYDKFVHLVFPLLATATLAPVLHHRYRWSVRGSILASMGIVLVTGIFWEYAEFYNDRLFGTQFFGVYGADGYRDTVVDLVCNFLGGITAAVTMAVLHPRWIRRD